MKLEWNMQLFHASVSMLSMSALQPCSEKFTRYLLSYHGTDFFQKNFGKIDYANSFLGMYLSIVYTCFSWQLKCCKKLSNLHLRVENQYVTHEKRLFAVRFTCFRQSQKKITFSLFARFVAYFSVGCFECVSAVSQVFNDASCRFIQVNCQIEDLYADLRDGHVLISLLEILSQQNIVSIVLFILLLFN